jgi:hypothetical protein
LKVRELEAINCVERISKEGAVDDASKHSTFLQTFQQVSLLIDEHPKHGFEFNNRAQLIRWRYGDHTFVQNSQLNENISSLHTRELTLTDLDSAIRLATPRSPSDPVSPSRAKLLAQAHTQRATLLYTASKDLKGREADRESKDSFRISKFLRARTSQPRCLRRPEQETSSS